MKITKLSVPLSVTVAVAGLFACVAGCAKKNTAPEKTVPTPTPTNGVADNTSLTNGIALTDTNTVVTNIPPTTAQEITNPPPAETTTKVAQTATNEANLPGHNTVVEMATNPPVAPTNFYPASVTSSNPSLLKPVGSEEGNPNYYLAFRGGYEHIYHGDNNDAYWLDFKFYAYGDDIRDSVGKNAWLIPDADLEVFSGYLQKADNNPHPGSDPGLGFRADFTWPWFRWTVLNMAKSNSICPFCRPLALSLGPTVNVGFDHLYDEYKYRFARYAGLRLTFDRSGFIEYTVGDTIGLAGTRQQIVAEIPLAESRDGQVHYYLRGLWNHGSNSKPDVLEGGIFLEMPLGLLISPEKWGDLVPFAQ